MIAGIVAIFVGPAFVAALAWVWVRELREDLELTDALITTLTESTERLASDYKSFKIEVRERARTEPLAPLPVAKVVKPRRKR